MMTLLAVVAVASSCGVARRDASPGPTSHPGAPRASWPKIPRSTSDVSVGSVLDRLRTESTLLTVGCPFYPPQSLNRNVPAALAITGTTVSVEASSDSLRCAFSAPTTVSGDDVLEIDLEFHRRLPALDPGLTATQDGLPLCGETSKPGPSYTCVGAVGDQAKGYFVVKVVVGRLNIDDPKGLVEFFVRTFPSRFDVTARNSFQRLADTGFTDRLTGPPPQRVEELARRLGAVDEDYVYLPVCPLMSVSDMNDGRLDGVDAVGVGTTFDIGTDAIACRCMDNPGDFANAMIDVEYVARPSRNVPPKELTGGPVVVTSPCTDAELGLLSCEVRYYTTDWYVNVWMVGRADQIGHLGQPSAYAGMWVRDHAEIWHRAVRDLGGD